MQYALLTMIRADAREGKVRREDGSCALRLEIEDYLRCCEGQRRLSGHTLRAYRVDLAQLQEWLADSGQDTLDVLAWVEWLNERYAPSTSKRKVASARAFFRWRAARGLGGNPFDGADVRIKAPVLLPRTIPSSDLVRLFGERERTERPSRSDTFLCVRNQAVVEVLIATGMRVSELCALDVGDVDLGSRTIRVYGKGSKERMAVLGSEVTVSALDAYVRERALRAVEEVRALFVTRFGKRMSDQAVRMAVKRACEDAGVAGRVTPHMFRHSFATMLLERGVDIRYIQVLLGHSSLRTTERYTHVANAALRDIMCRENPRDAIAGMKGAGT